MIRPEAAAAFRRWREALVAAAAAVAALVFLGPPALRGAPLALVALPLALGASAVLFREGLARARLSRRKGPGVVELREGAVAYFGPEGGGAVALDDVTAVELAPGPAGPVWRLTTAERTLEAPAGAVGADALMDALATLPGFELGRIASARRAARREATLVWRRPSTSLRLGRG